MKPGWDAEFCPGNDRKNGTNGSRMHMAGGLDALNAEVSVWAYSYKKRMLDILFSLCGLFFLSPLFAFLFLAVKLQNALHFSSDSAIYWQMRYGLFGRRFQIYKFRSMADGSPTKIGRILRHLHLDEIPQLYCILKGDMSLVGPRPEDASMHEDKCRICKNYETRLLVKPGLTGLAQIHGTHDSGPEEKLWYDMKYISNASFLLDMKILFITPFCTEGRMEKRRKKDGIHIRHNSGI